MNLFTERVIKIIKEIPSGHVMSYGQVASRRRKMQGGQDKLYAYSIR